MVFTESQSYRTSDDGNSLKEANLLLVQNCAALKIVYDMNFFFLLN